MSFLFNLATLSVITDGTEAAQGSESGQNVNAAGFKRRPAFLRIVAEILLGCLGEVLIYMIECYVFPRLGIPHWGDEHLPLVTAFGGPAFMAGGVYLAGQLMGGRGGFGWTLLASYGGLLALYGAYNLSYALFGSAHWGTLLDIPLWPLIGAIVAYEISDHLATRRIKRESQGSAAVG